jgi:hypothetical protein
MRYFLPLATLILPTGVALAAKHNEQGTVQPVSGYLDVDWEYPTFLPDDEGAQRAMPFSLEQKQWLDTYVASVVESRKTSPDQTVCFRITGEGRVVPRTPTSMWPATETLVISSVKSLVRLPSGAECESRLRMSVR